jgi:hypothetical protein
VASQLKTVAQQVNVQKSAMEQILTGFGISEQTIEKEAQVLKAAKAANSPKPLGNGIGQGDIIDMLAKAIEDRQGVTKSRDEAPKAFGPVLERNAVRKSIGEMGSLVKALYPDRDI